MSTAFVTRRFKKSVVHRTRNRFRLEWLEPRAAAHTVYRHQHERRHEHRLAAVGDHPGRRCHDPRPLHHRFRNPAERGSRRSTWARRYRQITQPVLIDGTSQSGYSGTPLIAIDGSSLSASDWVLWDTAGSSTIQGLAIDGCRGAGIVLTGGGNNLVQSCYIGTPDGTNAKANGVGIEIFGSAGNTIGGTDCRRTATSSRATRARGSPSAMPRPPTII